MNHVEVTLYFNELQLRALEDHLNEFTYSGRYGFRVQGFEGAFQLRLYLHTSLCEVHLQCRELFLVKGHRE